MSDFEQRARERAATRLDDLAAVAAETRSVIGDVARAAGIMRAALDGGHRLFFCGNGGSAADAQHVATEYVVRYMKARKALPAIALTTDSSLLTAAGNDLGFDEVFARQVDALVSAGDVLVIHSTSGKSRNVLRAAERAGAVGARVVGLTAEGGGPLRGLCDVCISVPTPRTDRAQELHLLIEHVICELIEEDVISLVGKTALVTGGTRGIGGATAELLARCGARVAVHYRSRRGDAEAMLATLSTLGSGHLAVAAELSDRAAVDGMLDTLREQWGGLDLFIGNAGIWPVEESLVSAMTDDRWARTMRENVDGMFFGTRAALRLMRDGGRVVLVSSTAGQRGEALHADYAASKGAMISFVKSLAIEVAGRGITVNSVAPGWVDTEMCADVFAGGGRDPIAAAIPVRRIATPGDIAAPIVFLCSDEARHITGEVLNVNGGSVLCG